jgi:hypothetical protein
MTHTLAVDPPGGEVNALPVTGQRKEDNRIVDLSSASLRFALNRLKQSSTMETCVGSQLRLIDQNESTLF